MPLRPDTTLMSITSEEKAGGKTRDEGLKYRLEESVGKSA